jgi:hypothetical protein
MTHLAAADEALAKKVSARLGRAVSAWKVAKLREAGLITWPARPGKRGRPGRAPGSYGKGAAVQAVEALELIRSKVDPDTAAVILYVRGWPTSLTARRRYVGRMLQAMSDALSSLLNAVEGDPDLWTNAVQQTGREEIRAFRSALGPHAGDVFEWITAVFAGEEAAIRAPHPDIASALAIEGWTEESMDYEDAEFVEVQPPDDVVERARRWSETGRQLAQTEAGVEAIANDEVAWAQARELVQVLSAIERVRRSLVSSVPGFADVAQVPIERVFTAARRPLALEKRLAMFIVLLLLNTSDDDSHAEALREHEQRKNVLKAIVNLANDCPRKWRRKLDAILCGEEMEENDPIRRWLTRWSEREPDTAAVILAEMN